MISKKKLIACTLALMLCGGAVFAKQAQETISVAYENIKLLIDGKEITPKDAGGQTVEPFIYDGTTYLPVRAIGEALGKTVGWDADTHTVSIQGTPQPTKPPAVPSGSGATFQYGDLIYENPLASEQDIKDFVMEGDASVTFENGKMRMKNNLDASLGQASNFVFWCNQKFPDSIAVEWEFRPIEEPGLAIMFFSANGQNGKDLFDPSLAKRTGQYKQYHSSDIDAFHVSYYRHSEESERGFRLCNLRKSAGFHMVAQGADPLAPVEDVKQPYKIRIIKDKEIVQFFLYDPVTDTEVKAFEFVDDGTTYGDLLEGGYIGFRQKSPLVAEYSNLKVYNVTRR